MFARLHHRQPIRGRGVRLLVAGGRGLAPARGSLCASRARGGRLRPAAGPGPVGGAAVFPTVKSEAGGASVLGVPSRRRRELLSHPKTKCLLGKEREHLPDAS